jgi:hypothetical protein
VVHAAGALASTVTAAPFSRCTVKRGCDGLACTHGYLPDPEFAVLVMSCPSQVTRKQGTSQSGLRRSSLFAGSFFGSCSRSAAPSLPLLYVRPSEAQTQTTSSIFTSFAVETATASEMPQRTNRTLPQLPPAQTEG